MDADALLQLRRLGIRTLGQYTRPPATGVLTRFGPAGRTVQRWAQALDNRPVLPLWESAEVSSRIEFEPPLASLVIVRQAPPMAHDHLVITVEDQTGLVNLIMRPDLRVREREALHNARLLLVKGRLQREGAAVSVLAQSVQALRA